MADIRRLRSFVAAMTEDVARCDRDEERLLEAGAQRLGDLVAHDDWLPEAFAVAHPERYQQFLLHCDPLERFSVVSFVWGAGQTTPVHDHTVWGLVAVMRGAERCEEFRLDAGGLERSGEHMLTAGQVDRVSPHLGDIHRVTNAGEEVAVSIHVYGANIGAVHRHVYDERGRPDEFVSGYSSEVVPNLWDRSGGS